MKKNSIFFCLFFLLHPRFRLLPVAGFFLCLFCCLPPVAKAQSDGLPRGAQMPYQRYEAENATLGGGAQLQQSLQFVQADIASEASNQQYVSLASNGAYVEWTVSTAAQGFDLRFTMPDNSDGSGLTGSLGLYVNGTKVQTINLSSYWAYQYFTTGTSDATQTPGPRPLMRFDEVHFKLPNTVNGGDKIRIQKDNGDGLTYGVDFIELEPVPAPLAQPANYLSVTSYGAVPNDGTDDFAAFNACISDAVAKGMNVYIPPGTWNLSDKISLNVSNVKIMGAGIWHTFIYFSTNRQFYGGILARASNVEISNFSMNTANNARLKYNEVNARVPGDPYKIYKAFMGTYGTGSSVHDVWEEHFECGFWIAGYDPPYPVDITRNLTISNCRIRNNYADGVNFCQGTSNSIVQNCSFRNNGDDAMAVWPNNANGVNQPCINDIFHNNTIENNWRAGSAALFGGYGHQIHHCVFKDGVAGSAIRFTNDFSGFTFDNTQTPIRVYENTITNCGTSYDIWNQKRGAIEFFANTGIFNLQFDNNDINNSQRDAVQMQGTNIYNLVFTNTNINGTGLDTVGRNVGADIYPGMGLYIAANSQTATFNNLTINNARGGAYINRNTSFNLVITNVNIPVTGVSINAAADTSLGAGQTLQLTAVIQPSNATNKNVSWASSNTAVATVDSSGLVTAVGSGTATITVTTQSGSFKATRNISVLPGVTIVATKPVSSVGSGPGTFTITATSISQNITVNYSVGGTATTSDYTANPALAGSINLTPANPSQVISITSPNDGAFVPAKTLVLTLQPGSAYKLGSNSNATVTIAQRGVPPCTAPVVARVSGASPTIHAGIDPVWSIAPTKGISNVVLGTLPAGFAGKWRSLYDTTNIYFLVEVNDNFLINDSGPSWWNDDAVEIFIDADNNKSTTYDGNDFQLGFRWNDNTVHVGSNSAQRTTGINFNMWQTATGYDLVVAIPWSTLGVTPSQGNTIGLDVAVDDKNHTGGTRDAQITSLATTSTGWQDPSVFGTVYLTSACNGGTHNPPLANAGPNQTLNAGTTSTTLQGSGSDPDGNPITFSWTLLSGPAVTISNTAIAAPTVTGLSNGNTYIFQLTVSDAFASATSQVQVTVNGTSTTPGTVICHPAGAMTIDGNLTESSWVINQPITKAVIGSSSNTGTFGVLWDNNYLYIGAKVLDATLTSGNANPWDNDAVEVYIDANNNKLTVYDGKDNQFIKGYNSSSLFMKTAVTGVLHAWAAIPGGYSVELAIPWSQLGLTAASGLSIGFDMGYDDALNSSGRSAQVVWNGTINNYQNTSAFGTLTLTSSPASSGGAQSLSSSSNPAMFMTSGKAGFTILPNPVQNGQARVILTGGIMSGRLQIFDLSGKLVYQQEIGSQAVLDLGVLRKGMYIVRLTSGQFSANEKLVVE